MSWNTAELLDRCLASLPAAADGTDCQVVVVDNASADDSADVVRSHRGATLIANPTNVGYARAMNQALDFSTGGARPDALVALNPDTVSSPGALTTLVTRLLDEPDVGLVAPRLVANDGTPQHSVYRFPSPAVAAAAAFVPIRFQGGRLGRRFGLEAAAPIDQVSDIDWAIGAAHVIRPTALGTRNVYNERWFMYAEDLDLCWTLDQTGWRRQLHPDVEVVHLGNAAGRQAWGDERMEQWLPATYDWYRLRRGEAATRRWAAVNTAGTLWRMAGAELARSKGTGIQEWQRELRPALRHHAAAIVGRGPGSPAVE